MRKPSKTLIHSSKSRVGGFVKSLKINKKCFQNPDAVLIQFFNDFELILGSFLGSKIVKKCIKFRYRNLIDFREALRHLSKAKLRCRPPPQDTFSRYPKSKIYLRFENPKERGITEEQRLILSHAFGQGPGKFRTISGSSLGST